MDRLNIAVVWSKGRAVPGYDPDKFRQDSCGAWMIYGHYGDRDSRYGWEVDHINPNGSDAIGNLQPLQWENNAAKGDGSLDCAVTAFGDQNGPVGRVAPYHSPVEHFYHSSERCPTGRKIPHHKRRAGTGNKVPCADCRRLNLAGTGQR